MCGIELVRDGNEAPQPCLGRKTGSGAILFMVPYWYVVHEITG